MRPGLSCKAECLLSESFRAVDFYSFFFFLFGRRRRAGGHRPGAIPQANFSFFSAIHQPPRGRTARRGFWIHRFPGHYLTGPSSQPVALTGRRDPSSEAISWLNLTSFFFQYLATNTYFDQRGIRHG
jgi:hypothetical protein